MARLRTFIAVDLDRAARDRAVALQETLARAGADVKWVEAKNLHITLLFLGEVDNRALGDVCRAADEVAAVHAPFALALAGTGCFGNPRRPRTLWAGIAAGAEELKALHAALEIPLLELGCYRREARPYAPHLTLGRVAGERGGDELAKALTKQAAWKGGTTAVGELRVLSSELRPDGPEYTVLSRAKLRAAD